MTYPLVPPLQPIIQGEYFVDRIDISVNIMEAGRQAGRQELNKGDNIKVTLIREGLKNDRHRKIPLGGYSPGASTEETFLKS